MDEFAEAYGEVFLDLVILGLTAFYAKFAYEAILTGDFVSVVVMVAMVVTGINQLLDSLSNWKYLLARN